MSPEDLAATEKALKKLEKALLITPWVANPKKRKATGGISTREQFNVLLNRLLPFLKSLSSVGVHRITLDAQLKDLASYQDADITALGLEFRRLQIVSSNVTNFQCLVAVHQGLCSVFFFTLFFIFWGFSGAIVAELKRKSTELGEFNAGKFLFLIDTTLNCSLSSAYRHLKLFRVCPFILEFILLFLILFLFFAQLFCYFPRLAEVKVSATEMDQLSALFFEAAMHLKKGALVHEAVTLLAAPSRKTIIKSVDRLSSFAEQVPVSPTDDADSADLFQDSSASWNQTGVCASLIDDVYSTRPDLVKAPLDVAYHRFVQIQHTDPQLADLHQRHAAVVQQLESSMTALYHRDVTTVEDAAMHKTQLEANIVMHKLIATQVIAYLEDNEVINVLNVLCQGEPAINAQDDGDDDGDDADDSSNDADDVGAEVAAGEVATGEVAACAANEDEEDALLFAEGADGAAAAAAAADDDNDELLSVASSTASLSKRVRRM